MLDAVIAKKGDVTYRDLLLQGDICIELDGSSGRGQIFMARQPA